MNLQIGAGQLYLTVDQVAGWHQMTGEPTIADAILARAIAQSDSFCRKCNRRMMVNNPLWITPLPPPLTALGKAHMAQFSMKIMRRTGSVLGENQQIAGKNPQPPGFFQPKRSGRTDAHAEHHVRWG